LTWKVNEFANGDAIRDLQQRYWCHAIVELVPDHALPELFEQMSSIWEYAIKVRTISQPLIARRQKAKVVRRIERPTFSAE
jgi:hypothetical protein